MSSGPAPCSCLVTAECSARESSRQCRRSRQGTSIAWCGMGRRAAMRFTRFVQEFSVGWRSHPTQPGGLSCCSRAPPSTFTGSTGASRPGRKSERGGVYWIAYRHMQGKLRKKYIGPIASVTIARLEEIAGDLERGTP